MAELTVEVFEEKLDSFAKIVKEGFDAVDERFNSVDERFNSVDERFNILTSVMGARFTEMDEKLERMDKRINGLYTLIDSFITLHQKLDIELTALRDKYNRLDARVARLEGMPA
ncbi:hypothetical protein HY480_03695 [Candidatus Uhrbacteria bacterium]|nr:hypothetical protein [Candidatus Uhrbacteria bacterium]